MTSLTFWHSLAVGGFALCCLFGIMLPQIGIPITLGNIWSEAAWHNRLLCPRMRAKLEFIGFLVFIFGVVSLVLCFFMPSLDAALLGGAAVLGILWIRERIKRIPLRDDDR